MAAFPWQPNMTPALGPTWQQTTLHAQFLSDLTSSCGPSTDEVCCYVEETDAVYKFVQSSGATTDGWVNVATNGLGVPGVWVLQGDSISIAPNWAKLQQAVTAAAGKAIVKMRAGTWNATFPCVLPNQTTIEAEPGVRIISTIAPTGGGGQAQSVFTAAATTPAGAVDTTTAGTVAENATVVTLTAITIGPAGANAAVGDTVFLGETNRFFYYEVIAVNVGAKQITLDRPTVTAFAAGVACGTRVDVHDILIDLKNGSIEGTGDRAINLPAANRCHCQNFVVKPDAAGQFFTDTPIAYDIGGRYSKFSNFHVDNAGLGLNCVSLESAESCEIDFGEVRRSAANFAGVLLGVSYYCKVKNTRAVQCHHGIWFNSGGGADIYGSRHNQISSSEFRSGAGTGIYILNGSSFNDFTDCVSIANAGYGAYIAPGLDNAEPTRNNSFVNCDVSGNTGGGFQTLTGTGTKASKDTLVTNLTCIGGGGFALDCGGSVVINGLIARGNAGGAVQVSGAASLMAKNVQIEPTNDAAFFAGFILNTTGNVSVNGLRGVGTGSGTKLMFSHTAGTLVIEDVLLTGYWSHGYSSAASAAAILHRGIYIDLSIATTNAYLIGAGSVQNFGTFTSNGVTQVDTTGGVGSIPVGAQILISLKTIGGTPELAVPYFSATPIADHFYTKSATAGGNGVWNWMAIGMGTLP